MDQIGRFHLVQNGYYRMNCNYHLLRYIETVGEMLG